MDVQHPRRGGTVTSAFGVGRRESHDSSVFYDRFAAPVLSSDDTVNQVPEDVAPIWCVDSRRIAEILPANSVALVVTSPPYFVGKQYEQAITGAHRVTDGKSHAGTYMVTDAKRPMAAEDASPVTDAENPMAADAENPMVTGAESAIPVDYLGYLQMLREVFGACVEVLEPGGRIAVNVANLGRKPYRSLSADVIGVLQDDLGLLLRGEIIWQKASGAAGSVAWGSYRSPANPVLRDLTERVIVASKGRFDRARPRSRRANEGLPHESTLSADEFMEATLDVWHINAESAQRVGHPAPFPVALPMRLIGLYTYAEDVVVDPFVGSGTTLVAAQRMRRRGIGFDLDPGYCEIARRRLAANPPTAGVGEVSVRSASVKVTVREALEMAGFTINSSPFKIAATGVQFDFQVKDHVGGLWYVDVAGSFASVRPGLTRTEVAYQSVARVVTLQAAINGTPHAGRVLLVTPALPAVSSPGDAALRACGPSQIFDIVDLRDTAASDRLRSYAQGSHQTQPGYWTKTEATSSYPLF